MTEPRFLDVAVGEQREPQRGSTKRSPLPVFASGSAAQIVCGSSGPLSLLVCVDATVINRDAGSFLFDTLGCGNLPPPLLSSGLSSSSR